MDLRAKLRFNKALQNAIQIRDNNQCQLCGIHGSKNAALNIHHIIPLHEDISKALDIDNLISLCYTCHSQCAHPNGGNSYDPTIANFLMMRIKNKLNYIKEVLNVRRTSNKPVQVDHHS